MPSDPVAQERENSRSWAPVIKRAGKIADPPQPGCGRNGPQPTWKCEVSEQSIGEVAERCDLAPKAKRAVGARCACVFAHGLGGWGGSPIAKKDLYVVAGKVVAECGD
jgi:hypothetical protein